MKMKIIFFGPCVTLLLSFKVLRKGVFQIENEIFLASPFKSVMIVCENESHCSLSF